MCDARSHEVFRPFDATRTLEQPPPGHPDPGQVTSFRLPCGSTSCSRSDLPGVFQPGASMGFGSLQSLPKRKSPPPFGHGIPSCDWQTVGSRAFSTRRSNQQPVSPDPDISTPLPQPAFVGTPPVAPCFRLPHPSVPVHRQGVRDRRVNASMTRHGLASGV